MRQGRSGDACALAQFADAKALWACAHQRVQNTKALFRAEGGKTRCSFDDGEARRAVCFHDSIFLETSK